MGLQVTHRSPALEPAGEHWDKAAGVVAPSFDGKGVPETIDSDVLDACTLVYRPQHVAEVVAHWRPAGMGDEEEKDSQRSSRLTR